MHCKVKFIFVILILFVSACGLDNKVQELAGDTNEVIECDAESWKEGHFLDKSGEYELSNANGRTEEKKRSGKFSLKLVKEAPYGMTIVLNNVHPDEYFRVTAWEKGNGHITASDDLKDGFYMATGDPVLTDSLGWKKLSLEFYVPYNYKSSKIKFLLANFGDQPVYFDDLVIERERKKVFPVYDQSEVLNIFITDKNYHKLALKRQEAIEQGLLMTESDDWVKAIIFYKDQVLDTRVRLKGDRLDHLKGQKWSFRIKIKGDNSWNGLKTFSIQTPAARNYIHEWFFHQALQKEDLLCTRYGFIPVILNGQSLGMYAWEEHFEKQLIEARNRREGPIMKLSDDSYWIDDKIRRQREVEYRIPSYDAAVITPFNEGKYLKDSLLVNEFEYGRDLYQQYKYARAMASDIFDLDKIARYYAMADATNAYHTLHFFNQRFYYNPVLGKLEPIFFDSFADVGIFDYDGFDLIPENAENAWLSVHLKMFADPGFQKLYFKYLEKYSSQQYWENLFHDNESKIQMLNNELGKEFRDYNFDIDRVYDIAAEARSAMISLKEEMNEKDLFSKFKDRQQGIDQNYYGEADSELLPYLINVYSCGSNCFKIKNFTTDTLAITGFSDIPKLEAEKLDDEILVPPANSGGDYEVELNSSGQKNAYVFVKIRGQKIPVPCIPWNEPNNKLKYLYVQKSFNKESLKEIRGVALKGDTVIFDGDISLSENLAIPKNKIVIFNSGTQIDLTNRAAFISYSPVLINGSEEEPVVFRSSDHTGKGFNVFQAGSQSVIKYAVFSGLTNLQFGGWLTTAGVCFYESDVEIKNTRFEKNINCDDALNIVRSKFLLYNCRFEDSNADAFDSDFSKGEVVSTEFIRPGNDAVDFSGSVVSITGCSVIEAGDKAISCGEGSSLVVDSCTIDGANIGVASKDKSKVHIRNSELKNITYGLVAFCKKPEYGPATISAENVFLKKYLFIHLIEEGSILTFNNREIYGQERDLASRFY